MAVPPPPRCRSKGQLPLDLGMMADSFGALTNAGEGMLASWLGVLRVGEDEVVDCTGFDFLVADPNADGEEGERADYEAVAARWPDAKVNQHPF